MEQITRPWCEEVEPSSAVVMN